MKCLITIRIGEIDILYFYCSVDLLRLVFSRLFNLVVCLKYVEESLA